jgi:8-oxo-dGTP diphosphatase
MRSDQPESAIAVVAAIVASNLGVVIVQRIDRRPLWAFPGGKIRAGESPAAAAAREVAEETGLIVRPEGNEIGRRIHPATGANLTYVACRPIAGTEICNGAPNEHSEVRWATRAEAYQLIGRTRLFDPVRDYLDAVLADR